MCGTDFPTLFEAGFPSAALAVLQLAQQVEHEPELPRSAGSKGAPSRSRQPYWDVVIKLLPSRPREGQEEEVGAKEDSKEALSSRLNSPDVHMNSEPEATGTSSRQMGSQY